MKKNRNIIFPSEFDELFRSNAPVPMKELANRTADFFEVSCMVVRLCALIEEEDGLKRHHRAYLHVHQHIVDYAQECMERIKEICDDIDEHPIMDGMSEDTLTDEEDDYDFDVYDVPDEDPAAYQEELEEAISGLADMMTAVCGMAAMDIKIFMSYAHLPRPMKNIVDQHLRNYEEAIKLAGEVSAIYAHEEPGESAKRHDEDDEPDEYFSD